MRLTIDHVQKALAAYESAVRLHEWVGNQRVKYQKRHFISISDSDRLYYDVHAWLLQQPASDTIRTWAVRSNYQRQLAYTYDGEDYLFVEIDGHRVGFKVSTGKPDSSGDEVAASDSYSMIRKSLIIQASTADGLEMIKTNLARIAAERKNLDSPPKIHIYSKWGWAQSEAPLRSLQSVVLDSGLKESVSADMARFLTSEADYIERGLPWHRGYLLHGPPGTGKTSLIKGLAKEHGLDIYFLSLTDMKGDSELIDHIHEVKPRSIVLLEDVDSVAAATNRSSSDGVTTSGLLNVLDGMFTPHGMIGVLTTNHVDRLDPAVIRPGRIDVQLHLDYCTTEQVRDLFRSFYQRDIEIDVPPGLLVTSAEITEVFKSNLYDPDAAESSLINFLNAAATRAS